MADIIKTEDIKNTEVGLDKVSKKASELRDLIKEQTVEWKKVVSHVNELKRSMGIHVDLMSKTEKIQDRIRGTLSAISKRTVVETMMLREKKKISDSIMSLENALLIAKKSGSQETIDALESSLIINRKDQNLATEGLDLAHKRLVHAKNVLKIKDEEYKLALKNENLKAGVIAGMRSIAGLAGESASGMSNFVSSMKEAGKAGGPIGLALQFIVEVLKFGFAKFLEIDKAAFALRKDFGLLRDESKTYFNIIRDTSVEMIGFGVTSEIAQKSVSAIADQFTTIQALDKDMVKQMSLVSTQLGISEETSAKLSKTMATMSGKSTKEASANMMLFTREMAKAAGVPLAKVLKDIANISEDVRLTFSGTTKKLVESVVEARRLGISIDSMAKSSSKLLHFYDSVNQEMEASVLFGRNINMQEARRLSFIGDIEGANKEILRQVSMLGGFDRMNYFQKKALADLTGKSIEDLQTMTQREKDMNTLRSTGNADVQAALQKQDDEKRKLQNLDEHGLESLEKTFLAEVKAKDNREKMAALQSKFNELMMKLSEVFIPIADVLLSLAIKIMPAISMTAVVIGTSFKYIATWLRFIGLHGGIFSKIFTPLSRIALFAAKWLEPIGWVILALQGLASWYKRIFGEGGILDDFKGKNFGKGFIKVLSLLFGPDLIYDIVVKPILEVFEGFGFEFARKWIDGLEAAGGKIKDALAYPFEWAWKEIKDWFGYSPSKLGLLIIKGISSVGRELLNILTMPFKNAWQFIKDIFSVGDIGQHILDVFSSIGEILYDIIIAPFKRGFDFIMSLFPSAFTSGPTIDLNAPPTAVTSATTTDQQTVLNENTDRVVDKLDELITQLKNGGIAVYLDGRQVNKQLAAL
jgi:hypothetical protein